MNLKSIKVGSSPAGSNTQIQFNNGGAFSASDDLTWNDTTKVFQANGSIISTGTIGSLPVSGAGTRFMWIPSKEALRAGTVSGSQWDDGNLGQSSIAFGYNTFASGSNTIALGNQAIVTNSNSVAIGVNTSASGSSSVAVGVGSDALSDESVVIGVSSQVSGSQAVAIGSNCVSSGAQSFSCGFGTVASEDHSFACGYTSEADGQASFCGGYGSYTDGLLSFVFAQNGLCEGDFGQAWGDIPYCRQKGHIVFALGKFQEDGDAQTVTTILRGECEAYGDCDISIPQDYEIPENFAIGINFQIVLKSNNNACAFVNRQALYINDNGAASMVGSEQVIGTDIDPDGIIDNLDFFVSNEYIIINFISDYDDDVGVVVKVTAVENGYTKPQT